MTASNNGSIIPIPVLLLKTPSSGHEDPYTISFSSNASSSSNYTYQPLYVPVLEHTSYIQPILTILDPFLKGGDTELPNSIFPFGGLIFTSQRAVEAFAAAIAHVSSIANANACGPASPALERLEHLAIPLYAVGPATALSLDVIVQDHLPGCWIRGGDDAGSGGILADVILRDYNAFHDPRADSGTEAARRGEKETQQQQQKKKPLLFLTGAKHRDIIPVKLASAPPEQRIDVEESIVYSSTESQSFASDIATALETSAAAPTRWIVIFSPTAGETLLRALGWLADGSTQVHGPEHPCWTDRKTSVASIGPTTRDYMQKTFGFEVDVCAGKPCPEGVRRGLDDFSRKRALAP
ncbi:MAG: hypothetical protein Q9196_003355 [Gyalolechia fulgens]